MHYQSRCFLSCDRLILVKIFLEAGEYISDFVRFPQVGNGVGNGVAVFELSKGVSFVLFAFLHNDAHVMREHEVEKDLLFAAEMRCWGASEPKTRLRTLVDV